AEHIINSDVRHNSLEKLRMLSQCRTHEQTAVAAALDRQFLTAGVVGTNQEASAGDEIFEYGLLFCQVARKMPFLPVLAASTKISDGNYATLIQPDSADKIEIGRQSYTKAPVASKKRRVLSVEPKTSFAHDVQRHPGAAFRLHEFPHHF